MTITVVPNVLFDNNVIGDGYYDNAGTLASFNYSRLLHTTADIVATNNTFAGIDAGSGLNMVNLDNCFGRFTNNSFIRGSSIINAYINDDNSYTNLNEHYVVDNSFDSITCNGTDEDLFKGGLNSTFTNNVNQTAYVAIPWTSDMLHEAGFLAGTTVAVGTNFDRYFFFFLSNTVQTIYNIYIPIKAHVPRGVKLISMKAGIFFTATALDGGGTNSMQLKASNQNIVSANYAAGTNSILDVKNRPTNYSGPFTFPAIRWEYSNTVSYSATPANTLYASIDLLEEPLTNESCVVANLNFSMKLSSGTSIGEISPLVIKYRW